MSTSRRNRDSSLIVRHILRQLRVTSETDMEETQQRLISGDPSLDDSTMDDLLERAMRRERDERRPDLLPPITSSRQFDVGSSGARDLYSARPRAHYDTKLRDLFQDGSFLPVEFSSWLCQGAKFVIPETMGLSNYRSLKMPDLALGDHMVDSVCIHNIDYPGFICGYIMYKCGNHASAEMVKKKFTGQLFDPRVCRNFTNRVMISDWIRPFSRYMGLDLFNQANRHDNVLMLWQLEDSKMMYVCMRREDGFVTGSTTAQGLDPQITMVLAPCLPYTQPAIGWR